MAKRKAAVTTTRTSPKSRLAKAVPSSSTGENKAQTIKATEPVQAPIQTGDETRMASSFTPPVHQESPAEQQQVAQAETSMAQPAVEAPRESNMFGGVAEPQVEEDGDNRGNRLGTEHTQRGAGMTVRAQPGNAPRMPASGGGGGTPRFMGRTGVGGGGGNRMSFKPKGVARLQFKPGNVGFRGPQQVAPGAAGNGGGGNANVNGGAASVNVPVVQEPNKGPVEAKVLTPELPAGNAADPRTMPDANGNEPVATQTEGFIPGTTIPVNVIVGGPRLGSPVRPVAGPAGAAPGAVKPGSDGGNVKPGMGGAGGGGPRPPVQQHRGGGQPKGGGHGHQAKGGGKQPAPRQVPGGAAVGGQPRAGGPGGHPGQRADGRQGAKPGNVPARAPLPFGGTQDDLDALLSAEAAAGKVVGSVAPAPVANSSALPATQVVPASQIEAAGNGANVNVVVDDEALATFAADIEIDEPLGAVTAKRHEPTGCEMLINVVEGEEVRIAIVRKGLLEELYMERASAESHVGNIYKGRVTNVEPSIQAAFVDFGLGKNGFLHISDLHPQYFAKQFQPKPTRQQPLRQAGPAVAPTGTPAANSNGENALQGSVSMNPVEEGAAGEGYSENGGTLTEEINGGAQLVGENGGENGAGGAEGEANGQTADSGNGASSEVPGGGYGRGDMPEEMDEWEIDDGGVRPMERVGRKTPRRERPPIQQCLRRGQEVIVQVTKEGIGTKGPTLTTYISCPGRYLVMMPGMSHLGVSRKIEDETQRRELRKLLEELNPPRNLGFIIRTAGLEQSKKELQGDLNYLVRMWKVIAARIRSHKAPVELYQESDLVIRTIRDVFNNEIDRIVVDNEQVASRIRDFLSIVNPRSAGVVEQYTGTLPIFQKYNIEKEIEKIHSRRVELANGGSLVIDSTEALVAIDVNSGRYREQRDPEMTAFNMNKEAVKEVVRQLRLRDLGGVVVIDFIDMREERHKREIERIMRDAMKDDRAKTKVLRMSQFCMVELTRQRVRPSLKRSIYQDCPHCHGTALIKTPESVSLDVMRRLAAGTTRLDVARLEVKVYPSVATYLLNRKRKQLVELEEKSGKRINIVPDGTLAGDGIVFEAYDARASMLNLIL